MEKYFWQNFHANFSKKKKNLGKLKNFDLEKINVNPEEKFFIFPIAVKYIETRRSVEKSKKSVGKVLNSRPKVSKVELLYGSLELKNFSYCGMRVTIR